MANTIGYGQGAVNNTNGWGKAPTNNTIDFGEVCADSWSPETNLTGTGATPSYQNEYSFSFDGVDEIFEGSSIYSEMNGGTKLTLSVWIKPISGPPILEYIISNPRNATANQHQFALTLYENNNVQFDVQGHNSQYVVGDINAITYGAWNHILACVDLDRTTGTEGAIFINGVNETTTSLMGTLSSFYTATDALHIGVDANGGYNRFNGNIDELAIWSGQDYRNASEVSAIYNSGVPSDLNNTSGIDIQHRMVND
jgi:hypothetical protein